VAEEKIVYLMRGLPARGKSHTAKQLAGNIGIVLETDQYFYTQVGDSATQYDYSDELLSVARDWIFKRFERAVTESISPIVINRGNGLNVETQVFARHAVEHGYRVELKEPESVWWQEIRILLKYKHVTKEILYQWADRLANASRSTHHVPVSTIRRWMDKWKHDPTVEEILSC